MCCIRGINVIQILLIFVIPNGSLDWLAHVLGILMTYQICYVIFLVLITVFYMTYSAALLKWYDNICIFDIMNSNASFHLSDLYLVS